VLGAATALVGLALVIVAACLVLVENSGAKRQLQQELEDIPELAEEAMSGATKPAS